MLIKIGSFNLAVQPSGHLPLLTPSISLGENGGGIIFLNMYDNKRKDGLVGKAKDWKLGNIHSIASSAMGSTV